MSLRPEVLDAMVEAGCTAAQIAAAVKAALLAEAADADEKQAAKRENNRERQRRFKDRKRAAVTGGNAGNAGNALITPNNAGNASPPLNDPQHSSSRPESSLNPTPPIIPPAHRTDWPKDGFDRFWAVFPRKQSRKDALKAWEKIGKAGRVPFGEIMAGLERYLASGPDPQFVPHPSTWLNGERWADQVLPRSRHATGPPARRTVQDVAREAHEEMMRNEARSSPVPALPSPGRW